MNLLDARTIELYLPNGNPNQIRIARDTVRPLNVISVIITEIDSIKNRINNINGCYMLYGKSVEGIEQVYFGESDNVYQRLKSHMENKDFWDTAYIIINDSGTFDKAHLHYIESLMISEGKKALRYEVLNGNKGQKSTITEQKEAECLNYFETIKLLLATLGMNVFKAIPKQEEIKSEQVKTYYYKNEKYNWDAKCKVIDDKFYVLKESLARKEETKSVINKPNSTIHKNREKLIELGILKDNGKSYVFTDDYGFNTPSAAAAVVSASHINGWDVWKEIDTNKSMNEIFFRNK